MKWKVSKERRSHLYAWVSGALESSSIWTAGSSLGLLDGEPLRALLGAGCAAALLTISVLADDQALKLLQGY